MPGPYLPREFRVAPKLDAPEPKPVDVERATRAASLLSDANRRYLENCAGFWLTVRPNCGMKDWLLFSIRRSRNREGIRNLRRIIDELGDEEILWIYENHRT